LADEPTGNLDSIAATEILDFLRELNRGGRTLVLITHDREVASAAPRLVQIRDGQIASDEMAVRA